MIFIDFCLLRSPYCKISYFHADIEIRVKMTQCAKIIAGFTANVGNVFIKRLQTFFFTFFPRFTFFLSERLLHLCEKLRQQLRSF